MTTPTTVSSMDDQWPQPDPRSHRAERVTAGLTLICPILIYAYLITYAVPDSRLLLSTSGAVLLSVLIIHTRNKLRDNAVHLTPKGLEAINLGWQLSWKSLAEINERLDRLVLKWPDRCIELNMSWFGAQSHRLKELVLNQAPGAQLHVSTSRQDWRSIREQAACLLNMCLFALWASVCYLVFLRSPLTDPWAINAAMVAGSILSVLHSIVWLGRARGQAPFPQVVSIVCFLASFRLERASGASQAADLVSSFLFVSAIIFFLVVLAFPVGVWWDRKTRRQGGEPDCNQP